MVDRIFVQTLDEFNYTSSVNFYKKNNQKTGVICLKGFEILFYNFDKIYVYNKNVGDLLLSPNIDNKIEISDIIKERAERISESVYTQFDLDTGETHIYQYTFQSLARDMFEKKEPLYLPKESDYLFVKERFKDINKKIITINGRNLGGDRAGRNNTLIETIKLLVGAGYYVVNCTIPSPMFTENFNKENYIELTEEEIQDYSKNISYFLNSDCVISVADSGGITNHICTGANIILIGEGGWVDNVEFGFNGKSLEEISREIKPTFHVHDNSEILEILSGLERPKDVKFFNEDKINYL